MITVIVAFAANLLNATAKTIATPLTSLAFDAGRGPIRTRSSSAPSGSSWWRRWTSPGTWHDVATRLRQIDADLEARPLITEAVRTLSTAEEPGLEPDPASRPV